MDEAIYVLIANKAKLSAVRALLQTIITDEHGTYGTTDAQLAAIHRAITFARDAMEEKLPELEEK